MPTRSKTRKKGERETIEEREKGEMEKERRETKEEKSERKSKEILENSSLKRRRQRRTKTRKGGREARGSAMAIVKTSLEDTIVGVVRGCGRATGDKESRTSS